jgi:hypothetical protein
MKKKTMMKNKIKKKRKRKKKDSYKTMASPVFACLHTKQITVVISVLRRRAKEKITIAILNKHPVLRVLLP